MIIPKKAITLVFFTLITLMLWFAKPNLQEPYNFSGDDLRYISYAVSLHEHGVFGLSGRDLTEAPPPGNANAPLYPLFIAGVMLLDSNFSESLKCIQKQQTSCDQHFETFFMAQVSVSILSLYLIYVLALSFSRQSSVAYLATGLALASGIFQEISYIFMTEVLILPAFTTFLLSCLLFYQNKKWFLILAIGASLALLTLVRPSYLYLFYSCILLFTFFLVRQPCRKNILHLSLLVLAFTAIVTPWVLRNKAHFNAYTLTSGNYAEAILIQRINYNQMSWPEVGTAMVYWLPDFGDSLAENLFPEHLYNKLGWEKNSYYAQQYKEKFAALSQKLGGEERVLGHLISSEILSLKHMAVSIPLAIRGTFIAKYWGLAGMIAFLVLTIQTLKHRDYRLIVLAAPLFFMVAFHAGLSVSIPRYNLPLIALYALCMAWYVSFYGRKIITKISHS